MGFWKNLRLYRKGSSCPLTSVGSQRQAACVLTEASEMECGRLGRQIRPGNQQSGVMMGKP